MCSYGAVVIVGGMGLHMLLRCTFCQCPLTEQNDPPLLRNLAISRWCTCTCICPWSYYCMCCMHASWWQIMEKFFSKMCVSRVAKKDWDKLWYWTQFTSKQAPERNGYTTCTCRWECALLLSYTLKWSRDVQVHCVRCHSLFQSFFSIPTYMCTCFFFQFLLQCTFCY